jgi:predicted enzyme related to lactoylglutathione lyase
MANQIAWCDIPVLDLDRAMRFYERVLAGVVQKHERSGQTSASCLMAMAK